MIRNQVRTKIKIVIKQSKLKNRHVNLAILKS